ncbi:FixH family protein [Peribacillus tepidiphilus]|uniref:FixH family protein n=1 Tax=Peribacillus tepidiphilus TaxID=2652445 RepID=UPI001292B87A|nr:FixH family protein [Peribacillus tepidiphilus]
MKKLLGLALISLFVLGGCSQENEVPELIEVKFKTIPETIKVNEEVEVVATVTQGTERVEDADEVKFEIWKEGQTEEQHKKIEAKHTKNGEYKITYVFKETGKYYVISHTTARGMHNMPKNEVIVK